MTKVQAAVGSVQLRRLDQTNALRVQRAHERTAMLKDVAELTLPYEPADCGHVYYVYPMLVPRAWAGEKRNRLMELLEHEYNGRIVAGVRRTVQDPPAITGSW